MKWFLFWFSFILFVALALSFERSFLVIYDVKILLFFESVRTELLNDFFYLFTEIGSIKFMLPLAVIVSVFLLIKNRYLESIFVMVTFWGVRGVNHLLKEWFERERPSFNSIINAPGYSFPSGHAMNSVVFFGFLFYLFIHILKVGQKRRQFWLSTTIITVIFIAISRVYLGVHYFTDVVSGASCGLLFLFLIISLYEFLLRLIQKLDSD